MNIMMTTTFTCEIIKDSLFSLFLLFFILNLAFNTSFNLNLRLKKKK